MIDLYIVGMQIEMAEVSLVVLTDLVGVGGLLSTVDSVEMRVKEQFQFMLFLGGESVYIGGSWKSDSVCRVQICRELSGRLNHLDENLGYLVSSSQGWLVEDLDNYHFLRDTLQFSVSHAEDVVDNR
nr:hypothetical protein [Tanacetum cinerariifolium]